MQQGAADTVLRLMRRKFGFLSLLVEERVRTAPAALLAELSEELLDFASIADAKNWIARKTSRA